MSVNFFTLLDIPERFAIDVNVLEKNYLAAQQQFHPDKFAGKSQSERTRAAELTSLVNSAYDTLKHPVKRAKYLLQVRGIDVTKDHTIDDEAILMEVMELRQELADTEDSTSLAIYRDKIEEQLAEQIAAFDVALKTGTEDMLRRTVTLMTYLDKIMYEIKVKGQGL